MWKKIFSNYEDWEFFTSEARHKRTGITFWIANGVFSFNGSDRTPRFLRLIDKFVAYYYFRKMVRNYVKRAI